MVPEHESEQVHLKTVTRNMNLNRSMKIILRPEVHDARQRDDPTEGEQREIEDTEG